MRRLRLGLDSPRHACKHRHTPADPAPVREKTVSFQVADSSPVPMVPAVAHPAPRKPEIAAGEVGTLILAKKAGPSPPLSGAVDR